MVGTGATASFNAAHLSLMACSSSPRIPCTPSVSTRLRPCFSHDVYREFVGYAWIYGMSLIVGSYPVLFVSLAAHSAQFAFLVFFENPRKRGTYWAFLSRALIPWP
jgi:hypothetical protein